MAKMDDESKPGEVEAAEGPEAVEPAAAPTVAAGDAEGVPAASPEELEGEGAAPTESDDVEEPLALPPQEVRAILEALIFASPQPIGPREIGRVLGGAPQEEWLPALEEIRADYARQARGLQLVEVAGGPAVRVTRVTPDGDELVEASCPVVVTISSIAAVDADHGRHNRQQPTVMPIDETIAAGQSVHFRGSINVIIRPAIMPIQK